MPQNSPNDIFFLLRKFHLQYYSNKLYKKKKNITIVTDEMETEMERYTKNKRAEKRERQRERKKEKSFVKYYFFSTHLIFLKKKKKGKNNNFELIVEYHSYSKPEALCTAESVATLRGHFIHKINQHFGFLHRPLPTHNTRYIRHIHIVGYARYLLLLL